MPVTRLSVSVVTYHSALSLLKRTLESVLLAANRAGLQLDLLIIDHSQDEGYCAQVQTVLVGLNAGPHRLCLEQASNAGYGEGHNRGVAGTQGEWHLVLNPDVELEEDALAAGIAWLAAHPSAVLAAPRVRGDDGQVQYLCRAYPSVLVLALRAFAPGWLRRRFSDRLAAYELRAVCDAGEPASVLLASGCFMLLRRDALMAAGGFDRRFFLYFEDYDLSLRLAEHGELYFVPNVSIIHHGGFAARKGQRHLRMFIRSAVTFFNLHGWRWW